MFNVNELAPKVANGIYGRVDASPEDFVDYDFQDGGTIDELVQHEIQDDLFDVLHTKAYENLVEALCTHDEVQSVLIACADRVDDYKRDFEENERERRWG